ncbi:MAG: hypothetical protein EA402_03190 [Planctomycetota bacterium]|nr:MAG: hypothetical protein EA402_03190 [Planctomycetota bacterium]
MHSQLRITSALLGALICLLYAVAPAAIAEVREQDFLGWPALVLADEQVEAVLVPEIGRLVAFGPRGVAAAGEGNRLWLSPDFFPRPADMPPAVDKEGKRIWRNYGGFKVWPHPWTGWPPDAALDGGATIVTRLNEGIRLQTQRSEALDVEVSMLFKLDQEQRLHIHISMDGSVERAIWPVVQVPGAGHVLAPLDPAQALDKQVTSPHVDGDKLATVLTAVGDDGLHTSRHAATHRKFDLRSQGGWMAHLGPQGNLRLRWPYPHPDLSKHPYDGSFYFNDSNEPARQYLELECYSPRRSGEHSWNIILDLAEDLALP